MSISSFFTPKYIIEPESCLDKAHNFVESFFDFNSTSAIETALKVIAYANLVLPAIFLALRFLIQCCSSSKPTVSTVGEIDLRPIYPLIRHNKELRQKINDLDTDYKRDLK